MPKRLLYDYRFPHVQIYENFWFIDVKVNSFKWKHQSKEFLNDLINFLPSFTFNSEIVKRNHSSSYIWAWLWYSTSVKNVSKIFYNILFLLVLHHKMYSFFFFVNCRYTQHIVIGILFSHSDQEYSHINIPFVIYISFPCYIFHVNFAEK